MNSGSAEVERKMLVMRKGTEAWKDPMMNRFSGCWSLCVGTHARASSNVKYSSEVGIGF